MGRAPHRVVEVARVARAAHAAGGGVPRTPRRGLPTEGDTGEEGGEAGTETVNTETEAEFTPRERRILLQKMFMQVDMRNLILFSI